MKPRILALVLAATAFAVPVRADNQSAPYAGQQARSIKSLSAEEVAALLKGEGMGMAKTAELNGYPGPVHVLTLANELRLTDSQRQQVQAIFDRMSEAAKPLGARLVEGEQVLDGLFISRDITAERLAAETAAIGELQGQLRSVHLAAHLKTRALLNSDQIARYQHLRGYEDSAARPSHHHPDSENRAH
jgi:Spy/CpxP family protein refolding chaperone